MLPALQYKTLPKNQIESNVPGFLIKLWKLVDDPSCDDLITWSEDGMSFIIIDQAQFAKDLLPKYFKHNNMASFVRQLNMYGFRKRTSLKHGSLRAEKDELEFYHRFFLREQEDLLEKIKRKTTTSKAFDSTQEMTKILQEVLFDVKNIHGKQDNMNSLLSKMKKENEFLWKEVAVLREKHLRQQQIVDKLIRFLVTLVKTNGVPGIKRSLPQVLSNETPSKTPRYSKDFTNGEPSRSKNSTLTIRDVTDFLDGGVVSQDPHPIVTSPETISPDNVTSPDETVCFSPDNLETLTNCDSVDPKSIQGADTNSEGILEPYLSDAHLDKPELFDANEPEPSTCAISSTLNTPSPPHVSSPVSLLSSPDSMVCCTSLPTPVCVESNNNSNQHEDGGVVQSVTEKNKSSNQEKELQLSISEPVKLRQNFTDYLEDIETELDWFQKILSQDSLNIDASRLNGVFSDDAKSTNTKLDSKKKNKDVSNEIKGNELVQYNPALVAGSDSSDNLITLLYNLSSDTTPVTSNSSQTSEQSAVTTLANNGNLDFPIATEADISFPEVSLSESFTEVPPLGIDSFLYDGVLFSDDESSVL
ncbi:heat shock factor protein-like isoform X2 [Limulus polyphemus]|uniref:Heat shock factor protein-like isoform X2 n=1 Tax=Limulus polyphemus TaxID=6850 RepID=A0ABM1S2L4_LIMPO|nr:heat shock factor protein-like isoform X2 [Limulus polyphemus]